MNGFPAIKPKAPPTRTQPIIVPKSSLPSSLFIKFFSFLPIIPPLPKLCKL